MRLARRSGLRRRWDLDDADLKIGLNVEHPLNGPRKCRGFLGNRLRRDGAREPSDAAYDTDLDERRADLGVVDQCRLDLCGELRVLNGGRIDGERRSTTAQENRQDQDDDG